MTSTDARWPRHAIAVLLIVAAGLLVVGVTSENDNGAHNDEPTAETSAADGHDEATPPRQRSPSTRPQGLAPPANL